MNRKLQRTGFIWNKKYIM